jgi:GTP-binding nuclear protein Ran
MATTNTVTNMKVVLIGDAGVGKTSLLTRLLTGEFVVNYEPTMGVAIREFRQPTTHGEVCFNVYDSAGQEKYDGTSKGYYSPSHFSNADMVVVVYDRANKLSFKSCSNWIEVAKAKSPDALFVLVGNKCDIEECKVSDQTIRLFTSNSSARDLTHCFMSVKSCYKIYKPFSLLVKKRFGGDADLVSTPPVECTGLEA